MFKKAVAGLLAVTLLCGIATGCTKNEKDSSSSEATSATNQIQVEKQLFDVTLTLPADYVEDGTTQEQLEEEIKSNSGIKSVKLNEDGSVTYKMTKKAHQEMMQSMADSIDEAMKEMVDSEDCPDFVDVKANEDYTAFTVSVSSNELTLNEEFSVLTFYFYGGLYGVYSGETPENIYVDFVNADTGEVIESSDSAGTENS